VASRGLDIEDLPYVVNFDMPYEPQDYIHRIGRTARAGAGGTAISLVSPEEVEELRGVQRLLRKAIPVAVVEAFLPDAERVSERPAPSARPFAHNRDRHYQRSPAAGSQGEAAHWAAAGAQR
jgi:ATP-dependent RNA helicase RhlE